MTQEFTSTKDLKRTLGFKELLGTCIGAIIGTGIMSLTGAGIGMTGRSIPIAFILAGILTLIVRCPQIFINLVVVYK